MDRTVERTCCFTGHRPEGFPWNGDPSDPRQKALIAALKEAIRLAIKEGFTHFIAGNALGVDSWAAEIVADLKAENPGLTLELAIPFKGHNAAVQGADWVLLSKIRASADLVTVVSAEKNMAKAYSIRNRYMVDHSSRLIAVYDERSGKRGGTERTLHYAEQKELQISQICWMDLK